MDAELIDVRQKALDEVDALLIRLGGDLEGIKIKRSKPIPVLFPMGRGLVGVKDAARYCNLKPKLIEQALDSGTLKSIRLPFKRGKAKYKFTKGMLDDFIGASGE